MHQKIENVCHTIMIEGCNGFTDGSAARQFGRHSQFGRWVGYGKVAFGVQIKSSNISET